MPRLLKMLLLLLVTTPALSAKLLILGDSLSAGHNMPIEKSWPVLLQQYWKQQQKDHQIMNASISGETTDGGLRRLPALLAEQKPDYILIELGANDGMRGFSPSLTQANLAQIISTAQAAGTQVILMQIKLPRNYGQRFNKMFEAVYPTLSEQYKVPLIPFLLDDIIIKPELMMSDGIHPKAESQAQVAKFVQKQLEIFLDAKN